MHRGIVMDHSKWDAVFLDVDYLRIMYHLAKYNPSVNAIRVAKKLDMPADDVEEKLIKLANLEIVVFGKSEGYTLTDKGLMSLYNFHKNFNTEPREGAQ